MQLPTVPSFVVGDTSLVNLQQLSQCVSFLAVASSAPVWRFYRQSTLSVLASTLTQIPMPTVAVDTDGTWTTPGIATIATQGYYSCEACVPWQAQTGYYYQSTEFLWTAGPSNPNFASGTQKTFGGHAGAVVGPAGTDFVQCLSDKCPVVCYPGDTIAVYAFANSAAVISNESNVGATAGWFPAVFSGRWVRTGT